MENKREHLKICLAGKNMEIPYARHNEFLHAHNHGEAAWQVLKIKSEFVKGYDFLEKFDRAVSIFGSARRGFEDEVYQEAEQLGNILAQSGFAVFTGGGPGIMEAANKGAYGANKELSIGVTINLPKNGKGFEERANPYVGYSESFDFFFSRKVILSFASQFYIFFPGGFGTLDELFEMLTLVQTKKTSPIPIILVGHDYWDPLVKFIKETVFEKSHAISEEDLDLFHVVADAEEAAAMIQTCLVYSDDDKD